MENEPGKPTNPQLARQRQSFVDRLRERRVSPHPEVKTFMAEVNTYPPEARSYLSFLTNLFLEKDIYEKIMTKPNSSERILTRLLNSGLSLQQANATLNYFKNRHSVEAAPSDSTDGKIS